MQNIGIEVFLKSLQTKKNSNQFAYLVALRLNGFMLCPYEFVQSHIPEQRNGDKWQYFVRATKFSKYHPYKDQFDYSLIFGVKYAFGRVHYVKVFTEGEFYKVLNLPWPQKAKKQENFKKPKRMVEFPEGMSYAERRDWRDEYSKHFMTPGKYEPTEFYLKWKDQILWTDQKGYNKRLKAEKLNYAQ